MISINATLFLQIIHFLILLFILNRILIKPIMEVVDKRRVHIDDEEKLLNNLEAETRQLAETIAGKSPLIISLIKKTINRGMHTDLAAGLSYEKANWALLFASEDNQEGINAFLEKRPPEFKGR